MKSRIYNPETGKYVTDENTFVSPDGKRMPVFRGMDFEDVVPVENEVATDVYFDNKELYENDVVVLSNKRYGIVTMSKGQYGVRHAETIEDLLAERYHLTEQANPFIAFADLVSLEVTVYKVYKGTIHDFDKKN